MAELTAWALAGDWAWTAESFCKIKGGRTLYAEATASQTLQSVILTRIEPGHTINDAPRTIRRYVDPFTVMELVSQGDSSDG